jgi:hypothetical protein
MKKLALVFLFHCSVLMDAQRIPAKAFLYGSVEVASPQDRDNEFYNRSGIWNSVIGQDHLIQSAKYHFYSPAAGIGFVARQGAFFSAVSGSYRYASKLLAYTTYYGGTYAGERGSGAPPLKQGDHYFSLTEDFAGSVYQHLVNMEAMVGFNFSRLLSFGVGYKRTSLIGYTFGGTLNQRIEEYEYQGSFSTLVNSYNIFYKNKDIKGHNGQKINGVSYLSFSLMAFYNYGKRDGMASFSLDFPVNVLQFEDAYLNLKLTMALLRRKNKSSVAEEH